MSEEWLIPLDLIRLPDASRVGRKSAALGALREAGFPVPPGACLTAQAFFEALGSRRADIDAILHPQDLHIPVQAIAISEEIGRLLEDLAVPQAVMSALDNALAGEGGSGGPLAVRSSAICEDSDRFSYAGQYASQIGVSGREDLRAAILEVWRSYFSPGALASRANPQAGCREEGMGVLIQPVIDAECAGVCLTLDLSGQDRSMLVVAAWGQGTGVVEGLAAADTYRVRRDTLETGERRIVEKLEKVGLSPAGGLERMPVPEEARRAACLPEPWLRRVAEFALAAELHFGCPQDVEWAIAGGKVWVLQSRPIAALPPELSRPAFPVEWETPEDARRLWHVVPFGAHGPLLPAEWDSTDAAAASRVEGALLVGDEKTTEVKFFNGRPYYTIVPTPLGPGDRRIRKWMMEDLGKRLLEEGRNTWDYWGPEIIAAVERLGAFDLDGSSGPALADHLENTLGAQRRHWVVHMNVWSPTWAPLNSLLASLTGSSEEVIDETIHELIAGEASALTRLIDGLYGLGAAGRESAVLSGFLASPPPAPLERLAELEKSLPEEERKIVARFRLRFEAFLAEWGDRTGKGFGSEDTSLIPWREDPSISLRLAALYEDPAVEPPVLGRQRARQAADARVEAILARSPDAETAARFRRLLAQARRDATILEDHNHYIDQKSSGQLRAALLACGRRLALGGLLPEARDVYWLRAGEICAILCEEWGKGEIPSRPTISSLVAERKGQHARWSALENLPILGLPEAGLPERPPLAPELPEHEIGEPAADGSITGQPASPGRRQGRACLVLVGASLPDISPGDILVAPNAGPLWTPFFPILGGVVLDGGNLGQHAAATAREYGIPAVIHARSALGPATRAIPNGAWVTVDGSAGIVHIEDNIV